MCHHAVVICLGCDHRQKVCGGPCACTIDGKDIVLHARERQCPRQKYPLDMKCDDAPPPMPPPPLRPLQWEEWPKWARDAALFRKPGDVGVGDTIKRELGMVGSIFEATMKLVGLPCRCPERREDYNALYPYAPSE